MQQFRAMCILLFRRQPESRRLLLAFDQDPYFLSKVYSLYNICMGHHLAMTHKISFLSPLWFSRWMDRCDYVICRRSLQKNTCGTRFLRLLNFSHNISSFRVKGRAYRGIPLSQWLTLRSFCRSRQVPLRFCRAKGKPMDDHSVPSHYHQLA